MFNTFQIRAPEKPSENIQFKVDLIPETFTGLIVGPPASGKSRLIADMLYNTKALFKTHDLVLFLVPYVEAFDLDIPEDRVCNSFSIDWVKERIIQEQQLRTIKNVLIIIDDLVSAVNKDHMNPTTVDFIFNRRKMIPGVNMNLIFSTQKFTFFPAKFRACLQWIVIFNIPPEDFKTVIKQHVYVANNHLQTIFSAHLRKKYNFIFIKIDQPGIFLNFDKQI